MTTNVDLDPPMLPTPGRRNKFANERPVREHDSIDEIAVRRLLSIVRISDRAGTDLRWVLYPEARRARLSASPNSSNQETARDDAEKLQRDLELWARELLTRFPSNDEAFEVIGGVPADVLVFCFVARTWNARYGSGGASRARRSLKQYPARIAVKRSEWRNRLSAFPAAAGFLSVPAFLIPAGWTSHSNAASGLLLGKPALVSVAAIAGVAAMLKVAPGCAAEPMVHQPTGADSSASKFADAPQFLDAPAGRAERRAVAAPDAADVPIAVQPRGTGLPDRTWPASVDEAEAQKLVRSPPSWLRLAEGEEPNEQQKIALHYLQRATTTTAEERELANTILGRAHAYVPLGGGNTLLNVSGSELSLTFVNVAAGATSCMAGAPISGFCEVRRAGKDVVVWCTCSGNFEVLLVGWIEDTFCGVLSGNAWMGRPAAPLLGPARYVRGRGAWGIIGTGQCDAQYDLQSRLMEKWYQFDALRVLREICNGAEGPFRACHQFWADIGTPEPAPEVIQPGYRWWTARAEGGG